jgi:hypothetical protein
MEPYKKGQKSVKHGQKILKLLKAVWAPEQVGVRHCQGHQKGRWQLFRKTKRLIGKPSEQPSKEDKSQAHWQLPCSHVPYLNGNTSQKQAWFETEEGDFLLDGWGKFTDGCIAIPESPAPTFVKQFHEGTYLGWTALDHLCPALLCPQALQHN